MNTDKSYEQIVNLERSVWEAVAAGDGGRLEELFAPEYIEITLEGRRIGRNLASTASTHADSVTSWKMSTPDVIPSGRDSCVLSYHLTIKGSCSGRPIVPRDRWATTVWRRTSDSWQRILFQQTRYRGETDRGNCRKHISMIRAMEFEDLPEVIDLWEQTEGLVISDNDNPDDLLSYLRHNDYMSCVATVENRIVAAVLCGHDGRRGYLHHLAVEKSHRRTGIASQLIDACSKSLLAAGISRFNLFLLDDNHAGRRFWENLNCETWDQCQILSKSLK